MGTGSWQDGDSGVLAREEGLLVDENLGSVLLDREEGTQHWWLGKRDSALIVGEDGDSGLLTLFGEDGEQRFLVGEDGVHDCWFKGPADTNITRVSCTRVPVQSIYRSRSSTRQFLCGNASRLVLLMWLTLWGLGTWHFPRPRDWALFGDFLLFFY